MSEKIQKVLARVGLGSRREIEAWIEARRVSVNGRLATTGDRISDADRVLVDGRRVNLAAKSERPRVLIYNKPEGEICTRSDPDGRTTVFSHLPNLASGRWIAVGRLDINTSGLLLFTSDGELANRLMHPSSALERDYLVRIHGPVTDDMIARLKAGVELDDGLANFTRIVAGGATASNQWFTVSLSGGRNREVRRLWESQGVEVSRLKRIRFGPVTLPSYVRLGQWLDLPPEDIRKLYQAVGLRGKVQALTPAELIQRERQERKLRARGGGARAPKR